MATWRVVSDAWSTCDAVQAMPLYLAGGCVRPSRASPVNRRGFHKTAGVVIDRQRIATTSLRAERIAKRTAPGHRTRSQDAYLELRLG